MTRKELREIGIYAIVTMILTIGIFSARTAISQDTNAPQPNKVNIQGLETWATVEPGKKPNTVLVKLFVKNPTTEKKTLDSKINLVRNDFAGFSISRTPTVSDNEQTVEQSKNVKIKLKGGATASMDWTWEIGASNVKGGSIPSYIITAGDPEPTSTILPNGFDVSNGPVNGDIPVVKQVGITLAEISASVIWNKK